MMDSSHSSFWMDCLCCNCCWVKHNGQHHPEAQSETLAAAIQMDPSNQWMKFVTLGNRWMIQSLIFSWERSCDLSIQCLSGDFITCVPHLTQWKDPFPPKEDSDSPSALANLVQLQQNLLVLQLLHWMLMSWAKTSACWIKRSSPSKREAKQLQTIPERHGGSKADKVGIDTHAANKPGNTHNMDLTSTVDTTVLCTWLCTNNMLARTWALLFKIQDKWHSHSGHHDNLFKTLKMSKTSAICIVSFLNTRMTEKMGVWWNWNKQDFRVRLQNLGWSLEEKKTKMTFCSLVLLWKQLKSSAKQLNDC